MLPSNTSFITYGESGAVLSSVLHLLGDTWDISYAFRSTKVSPAAVTLLCWHWAASTAHGERPRLTDTSHNLLGTSSAHTYTYAADSTVGRDDRHPCLHRPDLNPGTARAITQLGPSRQGDTEQEPQHPMVACPCTANKHRVRFGTNFKTSSINCKAFSVL